MASNCANSAPYAIAHKLLTLGFAVIPSGDGKERKFPLVEWKAYQERQPTGADLEAWQREFRPRLWGVVTGAISGLVVVDADTAEARAELEAELGPPYVSTPRGGAHWYFQRPGHPVKTVAGVLPGVDIRGDGGFINIAGVSMYGQYKIVTLPTPDNLLPWGKLPEKIRAALNGVKPAPATAEGGPILEGRRNSHLTSLAGTIRRLGIGYEAILAALRVENAARCEPPLADEEVERIARSVARYSPSPFPPSRPKPMATEAFYGLAGEVVRVIEPHTEGDPAALLLNFLTFFGNAVGRGPHAVAEADRHGCNLSCVHVGETSKGRKGSVMGHIRELFSIVDPLWTSECLTGGMSSGEGLIWAVRDRIEKVVKGESTIVDAGVDDKRLLVIETEFASPLRVMSREGNTLSAIIRQAWDSGTLRTLTKNSPAVATGAHISIVAHVTKDELLRYLNDIEAGNGFANRFLWACVMRSKVLPEGGGAPALSAVVPHLRKVLEKGREMAEIKRDPAARRLWAEIYPELSEGRSGLLGAVTARAEAQVLRLSVIYAVLDGDREIKPPHLAAALAVWDYCEASARYIFGEALGDPVADRILGGLRASPQGLSRTEISQLFARHVPQTRLDQALGLLLISGRAHPETRITEGRPVEVWVISHNSLISQEGDKEWATS